MVKINWDLLNMSWNMAKISWDLLKISWNMAKISWDLLNISWNTAKIIWNTGLFRIAHPTARSDPWYPSLCELPDTDR